MRVGVVTTSYPRRDGDPAGGFVAGLARWLRRRGVEIEVIAAGPGAPADGDIPVERVAPGSSLFYDEGAPERLSRSWRARAKAPLFAAALAARVMRAARRWDAVVSHWLVPSGIAAAATRRPHLAVAHSGDVHLVAHRGVADAAVGALLAGGPVRVAFAGAHLRERLAGACTGPVADALAARSLVCPMGIDARPLAVLRPEVPDPPTGTPIVAYLGRLVPIKGIDVLVEACRRLPRASLVIAGAGPERERLEALAQAAQAASPGLSVRFAGELRGGARDALFAAADVLVVPSVNLRGGRTEGTPVVALEALGAGVPLVATDVGGVRATVGDAARLVPPRDPAALAAAIGAALADWDATVERVRHGRRLAAALDWDVVGARLWDTLPPLRDVGPRA
jgi:glycosyltransferase involved in cell wall biosynthesis